MAPLSQPDLVARIALSSYRNITLDAVRRFEGYGVSAPDFFEKSASTLASITGVRPDYFADSRRADAMSRALQERTFVEANGLRALYCTAADYPKRLAECDDAPAMLYSMGDVEVMNSLHSVAIVGTRHCTPYGADFTRRLVADLAERLDSLLIVSGLAYGVDICAHRAALESGVPTGAVLAHGLNTIYPADHRNDAQRIVREGGFLATEYMSSDTVHRGNFLARNRIVAGLADVTIVVESDVKGGAMATARIASAYNREVMAVPGRVNDTYSRGCNKLIANRTATILRDADDLIELMGWQERPRTGEQQELVFDTPAEYQPVIDLIKSNPAATINDLCLALNMPFAALSSLLFRMELDDFIVSLPGGRYGLPAKSR